ncbi:unnamed protein product [Rhodiola kirilowii]
MTIIPLRVLFGISAKMGHVSAYKLSGTNPPNHPPVGVETCEIHCQSNNNTSSLKPRDQKLRIVHRYYYTGVLIDVEDNESRLRLYLGVSENPQNWESEERRNRFGKLGLSSVYLFLLFNWDLKFLTESVLEAEERLEDVKSEVEKMADIVTEQWIQFRHLEQALMGVLRMPLLLDQHLSQNMPAIKLYWSKVLNQVNMLLSAVKKYHLQLQDFVRQEMEKTQLTVFYTSEELVFFLASGLLTLSMYLDDATISFSLMPSTQTFIEKSRDCI